MDARKMAAAMQCRKWLPILLACIIVGPVLSGCVSQLDDDVLGLIVLKADLIDPTDALRSWSEDDNSPCNWTGIACDRQSGRVVAVQLQEMSLSGRIGRGLDKLSSLQALSLAGNNISGAIPAELSQLLQLRRLDLGRNALSGPVRPALGSLPSLKSLDLSGNLLSEAVPGELFAHCASLHYLSLASNFLDGRIPDSLGSCTSLRVVNLSFNRLAGAVPATLRALIGLTSVDLSHNHLSGPLPPFQPQMVDVRLQNNRFSGPLSAEIGNSVLLQHVDVSSNFLTDNLPDSLQKLQSLSTLNMANNFISGSLPPWFQSLASLKELNLSLNLLYGQIPSTMGLLKDLEILDFAHNDMNGLIPATLSGCVQLKYLDLSSNNFSGSLPTGLMPAGITSLKLSNNQLNGQLPPIQCASLQHLDLSLNSFNGNLQDFSLCEELEYLNASHNLFSSNIPSFHKGNALAVLDMSHNRMAGNIPLSIGTEGGLSVLLLNNNKITGTIPPELANCSLLTDINLSQNDLLGSIPPEFGSLTDLKALDLSNNNISGVIPMELGQLQKLVTFNVSFNQLEGPIPEGGNFEHFNESAFVGNINLCGANVEVTCPTVMPKPIVLNPNSTDVNPMEPNPLAGSHRHKRIMLSPSAILAIAAAATISAGVIVIVILNVYSQSLSRSLDMPILESNSPTSSTDLPPGKLVMFTKSSDPRSEEWVSSAHALLNKDCELGRGGFGTVYKAVLADGRVVAIKKLMVSSLAKSQYDFEKEIQFLGQIKHRNLVALQGYYWTPQLQLLILDFIPNGNVYGWLHEKSHLDAHLSWPLRFKIALGTARGLAHLHHACHPQVIHYNMKSSNVLLDEFCNPRIADYGLANLVPMLDRYLMSSKFQSALGYMAPEFACQSSKINEKCDVYGYGIMLLELVTGRRSVEYMEDDVVILCDYVRSLLDEGNPMICVEANLRDYAEEEVLPVIKLGLICTSQVPSNRPSMAEVVQILELIKTPDNSKDLL